ncbi:hypothetical protein ACTA71_005954 [Dictyostelium dimigraforme]
MKIAAKLLKKKLNKGFNYHEIFSSTINNKRVVLKVFSTSIPSISKEKEIFQSLIQWVSLNHSKIKEFRKWLWFSNILILDVVGKTILCSNIRYNGSTMKLYVLK